MQGPIPESYLYYLQKPCNSLKQGEPAPNSKCSGEEYQVLGVPQPSSELFCWRERPCSVSMASSPFATLIGPWK